MFHRVIQVDNIRNQIIELAGKKNPNVVYLGTATYESESGFDLQAKGFESSGCTVVHLKLTDMSSAPSKKEIAETIAAADIIAASGGNTLFAVTRWRRLGVDRMLKAALDRGAVMCGGSAGAICWFDGGHSDSRDPTTVRFPDPNLSEDAKSDWKYIRVSGLGFLPGICCPHHDTTQSNGVPRANDFDAMLMRQRNPETGIAIDDQAVLVVDGDRFRVMSTGADADAKVTVKKVDNGGKIQTEEFSASEDFKPTSLLGF